jgi:hypothetical protein
MDDCSRWFKKMVTVKKKRCVGRRRSVFGMICDALLGDYDLLTWSMVKYTLDDCSFIGSRLCTISIRQFCPTSSAPPGSTFCILSSFQPCHIRISLACLFFTQFFWCNDAGFDLLHFSSLLWQGAAGICSTLFCKRKDAETQVQETFQKSGS